MFLSKKIEATVLDVVVAYGCGAFMMYVIGGVAYQIGKERGKIEAKRKIGQKITYQKYYGDDKD